MKEEILRRLGKTTAEKTAVRLFTALFITCFIFLLNWFDYFDICRNWINMDISVNSFNDNIFINSYFTSNNIFNFPN